MSFSGDLVHSICMSREQLSAGEKDVAVMFVVNRLGSHKYKNKTKKNCSFRSCSPNHVTHPLVKKGLL